METIVRCASHMYVRAVHIHINRTDGIVGYHEDDSSTVLVEFDRRGFLELAQVMQSAIWGRSSTPNGCSN